MRGVNTQEQGAPKAALLCLLAFVVVSSLSACSLVGKKVSAFERGNLSKNGMQLVGAPKEQPGMNHLYNAREGSIGGFGGAGGGCGCN